jgi:hypothetical protein
LHPQNRHLHPGTRVKRPLFAPRHSLFEKII